MILPSRPQPARRCSRLLLAACVLFAPMSPGIAAPPPPSKPPTKEKAPSADDLRQAWQAAAYKGNFTEAEVKLKQYIALVPEDTVARYNLVVVQINANKLEEAEQSLQLAVEWGWTDLRHIERDPAMARLHESKVYRGLMQNWSAVMDRVLDGRIREYAKVYAKGYTLTKDADLRLAFYAAISPAAVEEARSEIRNVTNWWLTEVLPDGATITDVDPARPDPWIVILLPNPTDFAAWTARNYGGRPGIMVPGIYDSDKKELITKDIGPTLRHEYSHLIHWRIMSRSGQVHPTWIQEGLCSLPEDVQVKPGAAAGEPATITPLPSSRTNTVKRMQQASNLTPWSVLMAKDAGAFTGQRVLGNYAVARSIFLFLAQKGKLRAWFADYTKTYDDDPTGAQSIARVMGKPLAQVEKDWRAWIKQLPEVAEAGRSSTVSLPFDLEQVGEGLSILAPRVRGRGRPTLLDSPMTRAGLRTGDILVSLDDQPVRDVQELTRVLGSKKDGDEVELVYRRGQQSYTTRVRVAE